MLSSAAALRQSQKPTRMVLRNWLSVGSIVLVTLILRAMGRTNTSEPQQIIAIPVVAQRAVLDIDFEREQDQNQLKWLLVVGSLGKAEQQFSISLTSERISKDRHVPAHVSTIEPHIRNQTADCLAEYQFNKRQSATTENLSLLKASADVKELKAAGSAERIFHIHVTDGELNDARHYVAVKAKAVAVGQRVRIWLDSQMTSNDLAAGLMDQLVAEFDRGVVAEMEHRVRRVSDVDGDGRFSVLVTPWLSRLRGGAVSLNGFVRGSDFQKDQLPPFSNQADCLYLNSNLKPGPELQALLAHEFTHVLVCDSKAAVGQVEDDWVNEGLAHLAESSFSTSLANLDHRIGRFQNDTSRFPLIVENYHRSGLWRNHGCRGAVWSFFEWLQRKELGVGNRQFFSRLIQSRHAGVAAIESVTDEAFDDLFREWSVNCFRTRNPKKSSPQSTWQLNGPTAQFWQISKQPNYECSLSGTSFVGIALHGLGQQRITLESEPGSELQVSLIRTEIQGLNGQLSARRLSSNSLELSTAAFALNEISQITIENHNSFRSESNLLDISEAITAWQSEGTTTLHIPKTDGSMNGELTVRIFARDKHGNQSWRSATIPPAIIRTASAPQRP